MVPHTVINVINTQSLLNASKFTGARLLRAATPVRPHSFGRLGVAPEIEARVRKAGGVCLAQSRMQKICPDLEADSLFYNTTL